MDAEFVGHTHPAFHIRAAYVGYVKRVSERFLRVAQEWCERHPRAGPPVLLVGRTVRGTVRVRVVGLAAEAAFFSLLSLPALLLGLLGALGHIAPVMGVFTVEDARSWIVNTAALALTAETVESVVVPLIDDFLRGAQGSVLSVTFLVSLWSGSRAMNVFIDAITIGYGLDGLRGFVWQRALAFIAYIGGLLFALVVLPVLVAGPDLVHDLVPGTVGMLGLTYWPVVAGLSTLAVALLFTLSVPVHMPFWRHLPGALLATLILVLGSMLLRIYLGASFGQVSIYGSLAAPIAILVWFWVVGLAVLIGSALNAEIDSMWPTERTAAARADLAARSHARTTRLVERREQALREVNGEDSDTVPETATIGPDDEPEGAGGWTSPAATMVEAEDGHDLRDDDREPTARTPPAADDTTGPVPRQPTDTNSAHSGPPRSDQENVDSQRDSGPHAVASPERGACINPDDNRE